MASEPDSSPPVRIPWTRPRPYGLWETLGYSAFIYGLAYYLSLLFGQSASMVGGLASPDNKHFESFLWEFMNRYALATSLSLLLLDSLGLLFLWIVVAMRGASPRAYFGRVWPVSWPKLWQWAILLPMFAAALALKYWAEGSLGGPWLERFSPGSPYPLVLMLGVVVVEGPLLEELLFRGFLYSGIARSRLGPWAAIIITALIWATLHWSLGWTTVPECFALGIYLGWVRKHTGCIGLPVLLHMLWNGLTIAAAATDS